jgi:hypothetical protein
MSNIIQPGARVRELPSYRLGWNDGHDLGLRQALDAITSERVRLEQLPSSAPCRNYADGRLADVAKVVAAKFRAPGQHSAHQTAGVLGE